MAVSVKPAGSDKISNLIAQYGCGPVKFAGTEEALYERHLLFDNIIDASQVSLRERFEAVARSVRDILSQRWIRTEQTYDRENPKRVYYLSIEFLLGRSLANNIENLLLDPITKQFIKEKNLDLARPARTGTRRWSGQWRVGTFGGVFLGFNGDDATARDGLRIALRIRDIQAVY